MDTALQNTKTKLRATAWFVLLFVVTTGSYSVACRKTATSKTDVASTAPAPDDVVKNMFSLLSTHGGNFSAARFLDGKNLTPEEKQFEDYFADSQRCAVLFRALTDREAILQSLSTAQAGETAATVNAVALAYASANDADKTERTYMFDLKRNEGGWRIYELRSDSLPMGVYSKFLELSGQNQ